MKTALTRSDDPATAGKDAAHTRRKNRREKLAGKTFEKLTNKQKDLLLKELALRAGLLEDSDDQE